MKLNWLTAGVLASAALAAPDSSRADTRLGIAVVWRHDSRPQEGYYRHGYAYPDTYRIGFERGLRDGIHHGRKDSRHADGYNFWHDKRYRRGDAGYKRHYGPKGEYVSGYRRGYERGYRRAYAGDDRYIFEER